MMCYVQALLTIRSLRYAPAFGPMGWLKELALTLSYLNILIYIPPTSFSGSERKLVKKPGYNKALIKDYILVPFLLVYKNQM